MFKASRQTLAPPLVLLLSCGAFGCGDNTETPTTPGANQAPLISIGTNATSGIAQLTTFGLTATVTEPNGNPVSVSWSFSDGTTAGGLNVWRIFSSPGTIEVTATAVDHLGATTVSNAVTLTVASITGNWSGSIDVSGCEAGTKPLTAHLTQSGAAVTGTVTLPEGFCENTAVSASVASDQETRASSNGGVRLHVIMPIGDGLFDGFLDSTGQQITGTLIGTEPSGVSFTLTREP